MWAYMLMVNGKNRLVSCLYNFASHYFLKLKSLVWFFYRRNQMSTKSCLILHSILILCQTGHDFLDIAILHKYVVNHSVICSFPSIFTSKVCKNALFSLGKLQEGEKKQNASQQISFCLLGTDCH